MWKQACEGVSMLGFLNGLLEAATHGENQTCYGAGNICGYNGVIRSGKVDVIAEGWMVNRQEDRQIDYRC